MQLTFKLTSDSIINVDGVKLYRIEAVTDIPEREALRPAIRAGLLKAKL